MLLLYTRTFLDQDQASLLFVTVKVRIKVIVFCMLEVDIDSKIMNVVNQDESLNMSYDDLDQLATTQDLELAIVKYSIYLDQLVQNLQKMDQTKQIPFILDKIQEMMKKAWVVPMHGYKLGYYLSNALRICGGVDLLVANCTQADVDIQLSSAQLLERCLIYENVTRLTELGLDKVLDMACLYTRKSNSVAHSRVGAGILEQLFNHCAKTCTEVVKLGGLDALLFACTSCDIVTVRHCIRGLANLSICGGAENREAMMERKVSKLLTHVGLTHYLDPYISYYVSLALKMLNTEMLTKMKYPGVPVMCFPFGISNNISYYPDAQVKASGTSTPIFPFRIANPNLGCQNGWAIRFPRCVDPKMKEKRSTTNIFTEFDAWKKQLKIVTAVPLMPKL